MADPLNRSQGLTLAIVTVVASAGAAAWAASWSAPPPAPPARPDVPQVLVDELRELVRALRKTPLAPEDVPARMPARREEPATAGAGGPDDRLDRLAAAIERLAARGQQTASEPLDSLSPRDRTRPVSWEALRLLAQQTRTDPENARRSVLFLSPRQIVERYGLPTDMGGGDGRVWLQYEYPQAGGAEYVYLHFVFVDGMLMRYDAETGS